MNEQPDRRTFLKKGLFGVLGGFLGLHVVNNLPELVSAPALAPSVAAIGPKQQDLILAAQRLMQRIGIFHTLSIDEYANDGQIQANWSTWIPSEDQISSDADNLAKQVLQLAGQ
jgi:hypothetical protein